MIFYTRDNVSYPLPVLLINRMLIYGVLKHTDRIACCILKWKDSYFTQRFLQGRNIQKLITLEVFVLEASYLQFLNGL